MQTDIKKKKCLKGNAVRIYLNRLPSNEEGNSHLLQESITPMCIVNFKSCFKTRHNIKLASSPNRNGLEISHSLGEISRNLSLQNMLFWALSGFACPHCLHVLQWHPLSKSMQMILSRIPNNTYQQIRKDTRSESMKKWECLGLVSGGHMAAGNFQNGQHSSYKCHGYIQRKPQQISGLKSEVYLLS